MPSGLSPAQASDANTYTFKARPVNKKIMESVGDLGVPRVSKKAPTVQKEFNLSQRPASARARPVDDPSAKPLYSSFASAPAKPPAKKIVTSAPTAPKSSAGKQDTTKVKEFALSSSQRPQSARKPVDVHDEFNRPIFSSFGTKAAPPPASPRAISARGAKPAAPASAKKPPVTTSAEPEAKAAEEPVSPTEISAAPSTEGEPVDVCDVAPAAPPAPDTDATTKAAPSGARRVWAKDALPAYLEADDAADDEDDEDVDFVPEPTKKKAARQPVAEDAPVQPEQPEQPAPTSKARKWGVDNLPEYLEKHFLASGEEDDEEEDGDYEPTPRVKKVTHKVSRQTVTPKATPKVVTPKLQPTIAHGSMHKYAEHTGVTPSQE